MPKDGRIWARIDVDMPDNAKIMPLSDAAFRALIEMILWSRKHLTDGLLARRYAVARWSLSVCQELCSNDPTSPSLVEVTEGFDGYQIRDFSDFQESRAEVEARRERNKRAGQRGGLARAKRLASESLSETQPETETETELPTTDVVGRARVRATQLPTSWTPNLDHHKRARSAGLDLDREATKFRAHAEEKGRTAKNWNAAFTRWLMNSAEYAARDARRGGSPTTDRQMQILRQEMERAREWDNRHERLEIER